MPAPVHILETRQQIARPIAEVFAFFASPENLEAITPPWLEFRIRTPRPIRMHEGATIDYSIRLRRVPLRWRTRIDRFDPPHCFVDTQVKGPYRLWEHTHTFAESSAHGAPATVMVDRIRYALIDVPPRIPLLGDLVHRTLVRPDLDRIFQYRRERIAHLLEPHGQLRPSVASSTP